MRNSHWRAGAAYIALALAAMGLGIFIRSCDEWMPAIVASHAGDILWASMVYWGIRAWLRERYRPGAALISLLLCYGIELSQMYQAHWAIDLRSTTLGGLVLGQTFQTPDMIRYSIGVAIAGGLDAMSRLLWMRSIASDGR